MSSVLIVDDESLICELLLLKLAEDKNIFVKAATNLEEALSYLKKYQFDILISDYHLQEVKGDELIKRALVLQPHIRPYLMSVDLASIQKFSSEVMGILPKRGTLEEISDLFKSMYYSQAEIDEVFANAHTRNDDCD